MAMNSMQQGALIYALGDKVPKIDPDVFLAPGVVIVGDVTIGAGTSIWFGSIVRGDVDAISIGRNCNIQDGSILHVTRDRFPVVLGDNVSLGHRVTLHGCRLASNTFVGMNSMVMDDCELGEMSLLAAGSFLAPGKSVPPGMLAMGSPAKVVRELRDEDRDLILRTAKNYVGYREMYREDAGFRLLSL